MKTLNSQRDLNPSGGFSKVAIFILCTCFGIVQVVNGAIPVPPAVQISIKVVHETFDGVILSWSSSLPKEAPASECVLHYKALEEGSSPASKVISSSPSLVPLNGLLDSLNYSAYIICQLDSLIYPSNTVQFSPRSIKTETTSQKASTAEITRGPLLKISDSSQHLPSTSDHKREQGAPNEDAALPNISSILNFTNSSQNSSFSMSSSLPINGKEVNLRSEAKSNARLHKETEASLGEEGSNGENVKDEEVPLNDGFMNHEKDLSSPRDLPRKEKEKEGRKGILMVIKERHMDSLRIDPHRSTPSSSVILGAVCGVVGFLIINVTVVMVVRLYSLKRARRRQFLEMQLQQNDGYIFNIDEFINA